MPGNRITGRRMAEGYAALTEKEKQTLRLLVRGHDAKSSARHLGLSVHTINERLRHARRKLSVSSSREAARLVLDREGGPPNSLADKQIGEAGAVGGMADDASPKDRAGKRRLAWAIAGGLIMSLILATLALSLTQTGEPPARLANASASQAAAESVSQSEAVRATRQWLALIDADDWAASYAATGRQFQDLNTLEVWTSVSEKARADLGERLSRTLIEEEWLPAPPHGLHMVKFRTSFANRPEAVETLSLAQEDGAWKVVGYVIG